MSRFGLALVSVAAVHVIGCGSAEFGSPPYSYCHLRIFGTTCLQNRSASGTHAHLSHRVFEGSVDALATTVRSDPELRLRAVGLAASLSPLLGDDGGGNPATISPETAHELFAFLAAVEDETSDDDLGHTLRAIRETLDPVALIGRTGPEAAQLVMSVLAATLTPDRPDAALSLQPRDRGVAWEGDTVVVPAAARAPGALGTRWRTDLVLTNPGAPDAIVTLALLVRGQANPAPQEAVYVLAGGESLFLDDVLASAFSFDGAAALRVTAAAGTVAVTSRTYNQLAGPGSATFGQFIPALTEDDVIGSGDQGRIIQLAHDPSLESGTRTNLILVNGADVATDIDIDLRAADGSSYGVIEEILQPWEYRQLDRVFEQVTSSVVEDGHAIIRPTSPGGRVYAIASAVDNLTGDPIAVAAALRSPEIDVLFNTTWTIPAAAHVSGRAGTNWRTDLVIHALTGVLPVIQVDFLPRGEENLAPPSHQIRLAEGQSARYEDVLQSLFSTEGAGSIRLTPYGGSVAASSRTYNLLGEGNDQGLEPGSTFGQYMGPVAFTRSIVFGERAWIPHLSHDPSLEAGSRTNLGLISNATRPIDVVVELYRGDGTALGSFTTTLRQWENVQVDKVFERVTSEPVAGGYAVAYTTNPAGAFHVYGSVVDNTTGDPITIDAMPVRRPDPFSSAIASVNAMMDVFDLGLAARSLFDFMADTDLDTFFDQLATSAPDRVTRTDTGARYDLGVSSVFMDQLRVGGRVEVAPDLVSTGDSLSGTVRIDLDDVHVDGLAPVVDDLDLVLELNRTGNDHVAGTVAVAATARTKTLQQLDGTLQFDTAVCELYPIGGELTLVYGGQTYTLSFDDRCSGGVAVAAPVIEHWRLRLAMRDCAMPDSRTEYIVHLVSTDGVLDVDPDSSDPDRYGRRRWAIGGTVNASYASVDFVQRAGPTGAATARDGQFRGERSRYSTEELTYYTGTYDYSVFEGSCQASYYESRSDPELIVGILESCDGPCVN